MVHSKTIGIALALLAVPSLTARVLVPSSTKPGSASKRGYSVDPIPTNSDFGDQVYSWPPLIYYSDGTREVPIYYCWESQETADKFSDVFMAALDKWAPALYPNSAVYFSLHTAFQGSDWLPCEALEDPVSALKLGDGGDGASRSTIGYDYGDTDPFRHWLYMSDYVAVGMSWDEAVLDCAHELGHVLGLGHEHQCSDRDHWVRFQCRDLAGEGEARDTIERADDTRLGDGNTDEKLERVCSDGDLAEYYFPRALDYMKGQDAGYPFAQFQDIGEFDHNSIMIYSTWQNIEHDPDDDWNLDSAELVGLDASNGEVWRIFQGGSSDASRAGPTAQDLAAVVGLYPA